MPIAATGPVVGSAFSSSGAPAAHAASHDDGASDEILVEALATASVGTTLSLMPDGAGGLAFGAPAPAAHALGGALHTADTLANLNSKVSDATLIDTGDARLSDARTPTSHSLGGAEHAADTLANLNTKISDGTLVTSSLIVLASGVNALTGDWGVGGFQITELAGLDPDSGGAAEIGTSTLDFLRLHVRNIRPGTTQEDLTIESNSGSNPTMIFRGASGGSISIGINGGVTPVDNTFRITTGGSIRFIVPIGTPQSQGLTAFSNNTSDLGTEPLTYRRLFVRGIRPDIGATLTLEEDGGASAISIGTTVTTINEPGADRDTRLEGAADSNLMTWDAGLDMVGVGVSLGAHTAKLHILQTAVAMGLFIDQDTNDRALEIDSEATSQPCINIKAPATTSGMVFDVDDADSLTSGTIVNLKSNSADVSARALAKIINDNTLAVGCLCLEMRQDALKEVMSMDLGTLDVGFIDFIASIGADATSAISSFTTSGAPTHHVQFSINGTPIWVLGSTNDPTA